MSNKFTSPPPDDFLAARLQVLLDDVNTIYQQGGTVMQDEILDLYNEGISTFLDSLDNSILGVTFPIMRGMPADPVDYNVFTVAIEKDLRVLFLEAGAVDRLVASNFNTIIALRDQVLSISRRIASKTADYLLYADPALGNGFFFGDSFNSAKYLDLGSSLVKEAECYVNQEEGIVLLPLDAEPERISIIEYKINENSNGVVGNNQQINSSPHNNIAALGDGEPDTWFEYERVTSQPATTPLLLDLTVTLETATIINMIHIFPIQFGTPAPVKILKLETSKDGSVFTSVKDEIPIADFLSEEEDDVFVLSGKSGKYSGEGYFSFLPRRCKYIHLVLQQSTPYSIDTNQGTRLRYAVGLRDINIYTRKFAPEGSIVSTPINVKGDATKVSIWVSENPSSPSKLADITHEISADDGANWIQIQPQGRTGVIIPEIVNLNNADANSISTGNQVPTLRHKISMVRNKDAFTGNVTIKSEKLETMDIVPVPSSSPYRLLLQNEPIPETVHISLSTRGSYSCPIDRNLEKESPPMRLDFVEYRIDNSSTGSIRFALPFKISSVLKYKIRVFVNGESWRQGIVGETAWTTDSRVYFLNQDGRELQFVWVDSSNVSHGKLPGAGSRIQVCLDGDSPRLERTDTGYTLLLSESCDGIKENVSLSTVSNLYTPGRDIQDIDREYVERNIIEIAPQQTIVKPTVQTNTRLIDPDTDLTSNSYILHEFWQEVEVFPGDPNRHTDGLSDPDYIGGFVRGDGYVVYIDGDLEFYDTIYNGYQPRRYTFDPKTGTVYFASPISTRAYLEIKVLETVEIPITSWSFYKDPITKKLDTSRILLDPAVIKQFPTSMSVSGRTSFQLAEMDPVGFNRWNQRLVRGSIRLSSGIITGVTQPIEIPFQNGYTELQNTTLARKTIDFVSGAGSHTLSNILDLIDATDRPLRGNPIFSPINNFPDPLQSNQFINKKETLGGVSTSGDYHIALDGTVTIWTDTGGLQPHVVTYEYEDMLSGLESMQLFSVDYENGVIYFNSNAVVSGTIAYNLTSYSAFYNIGEVVSTGNIKEINEEGKYIELHPVYASTLSTKDALGAPKELGKARIQYQYYKKSTESLRDLEPYFSPVCKDIAIRVITKEMMGSL